jgi:hypothetical protein
MTDDILEKIIALDVENLSIEEIEEHLSHYILRHTRPNVHLATTLFRSRIIKSEDISNFNTVECIWYRDWNKVSPSNYSYGRCNNKGQNFFYGSNYLEATINEINPKNGDYVMTGVFALKNPAYKFIGQFAGLNTIIKSSQFKTLDNYKFKTIEDFKLEEILSQKFQDRINENESHKYKFTIALSNILLKNDEFSCIVYPSVASDLKYVNFGIKPECIDSLFYCQTIEIFEVKKTTLETTLIPLKFARISSTGNHPKFFELKWEETSSNMERELFKFNH